MRRQVGAGIALSALAAGLFACGGGGGGSEPGDGPERTASTVAEASEGCLLSPGEVGAALDLDVAATGPVAGGGEQGASWRGCAYASPDGAEVTVAELVDGRGEADAAGFDRLAGDAARVGGIGDEAVVLDGRLAVRVGDRAAVAEGTTAGGEPFDGPALAALGEAVAGALA